MLYILQPISEEEFGGADMHVLELCSNIKNSGQIEPIVLIRCNQRLQQRFIENNITCFCGSHLKNLLPFIRWANSELKSFPIQLIHSHGYDANYHMVLLKLFFSNKWKGIKTVITSHGWIETTAFLKFKTWLDFYCLRYAQGLIVCSRKNLDRIKHFNNKAFITYIPNGISIDTLEEKKTDSDNLIHLFSSNTKNIGFVGRLSSEKRIDLFILLAKEIISLKTNVSFFIVGEGIERNNVKELIAKYQIHDNVHLLGLIENIRDVYPKLDLLILPSDTESTPRVILESLLHKVPVVASNVGSISEVIQNGINGFLFEKGDINELVKHTLLLIKNTELSKNMGLAGQHIVMSKYTMDIMRQKTVELYQKVLNKV